MIIIIIIIIMIIVIIIMLSVMRASSPLVVRNVCEDQANRTKAPGGPRAVLEPLADFLAWARWRAEEEAGAARPTLYYVVLATNAFFNQLPGDDPESGPLSLQHASEELARRYDQVAGWPRSAVPGEPAPVVAAVERLCRRGVGSPCPEDSFRQPT